MKLYYFIFNFILISIGTAQNSIEFYSKIPLPHDFLLPSVPLNDGSVVHYGVFNSDNLPFEFIRINPEGKILNRKRSEAGGGFSFLYKTENENLLYADLKKTESGAFYYGGPALLSSSFEPLHSAYQQTNPPSFVFQYFETMDRGIAFLGYRSEGDQVRYAVTFLKPDLSFKSRLELVGGGPQGMVVDKKIFLVYGPGKLYVVDTMQEKIVTEVSTEPLSCSFGVKTSQSFLLNCFKDAKRIPILYSFQGEKLMEWGNLPNSAGFVGSVEGGLWQGDHLGIVKMDAQGKVSLQIPHPVAIEDGKCCTLQMMVDGSLGVQFNASKPGGPNLNGLYFISPQGKPGKVEYYFDHSPIGGSPLQESLVQISHRENSHQIYFINSQNEIEASFPIGKYDLVGGVPLWTVDPKDKQSRFVTVSTLPYATPQETERDRKERVIHIYTFKVKLSK